MLEIRINHYFFNMFSGNCCLSTSVLYYLLRFRNTCTLCVDGTVFSCLDYIVLHIYTVCYKVDYPKD